MDVQKLQHAVGDTARVWIEKGDGGTQHAVQHTKRQAQQVEQGKSDGEREKRGRRGNGEGKHRPQQEAVQKEDGDAREDRMEDAGEGKSECDNEGSGGEFLPGVQQCSTHVNNFCEHNTKLQCPKKHRV